MAWYDNVYPLNINPFKGVAKHLGQVQGNNPSTWLGGMSGKTLGIMDDRNQKMENAINSMNDQSSVIDTSNPKVNFAGFNFGNNQNTNNQNTNQVRGYQNYDGAQEYNPDWNPNNPNYGKSFAGVGRFDPRNMMRPDNLSQDLGASTYQAPTVYPGQRNIHEGFGTADVSSTFEPPERTGFLSGITGPVMGGLKWLGEKFKRPDAKQRAYDAITGGQALGSGQWTRGNYGGNEYDLYNSPSGLKVGSEIIGRGEGYEKNFDSMFGSKSLEEMEQKQLDWFRDRVRKGKSISQRGYGLLDKHGYGGGNIGDQRPGRTITETEIIDRPVNTGGTTTGGGGRHDYGRDRGGGYTLGGGFADQRSGARGTTTSRGDVRGHHSRAEGGRIGYQEGELVEDESMFEATPRGMMEENIEEVQGEPTREQLELIALEIFRLPLEELNEEQLNVVYQAAMEQEPAEEEIQFAAQEGPGEGIASLV